ncbi:MAG: hypothetical protein HY722_06030 [Planctomycetes bacterium]|nr:hypothetical protein [Planctomycetota bacterium]
MVRGFRSVGLAWVLLVASASGAPGETVDEAEALKAYRSFLVSLRARIYVEVDGRRSDVLIQDAQEGVDDVLRLLDRYLADPASVTEARDKEKVARLAGSAELTFSHVHRGRASALAGTAFRVFVANVSDRYVGVWFGTPFGLKEAYLETLTDYYPRKEAAHRGEDGREMRAADLRAILAGMEKRLDAEAREARAAVTKSQGPEQGLVERLDEVKPANHAEARTRP